jgi:hypothetical protein
LSRPIIARLRSESHQNDGITVRGRHQRLLQQNLPKPDSCSAAKSTLYSITASATANYVLGASTGRRGKLIKALSLGLRAKLSDRDGRNQKNGCQGDEDRR